jgi:uncharacterized membrane protein YgcG
VAENRRKKELIKQNKEFETTVAKVEKVIKEKKQKLNRPPYDIKIKNSFVEYLFYEEPTGTDINNTSNHFLTFEKYTLRKQSDYKPWEKTEHNRKKTFVYQIDNNVDINIPFKHEEIQINVEDGFDDFNPKILTVAILNSILVNQINYLTENGENNTAGNGAGGGGGGGGGKGNMLQQLLGKLQPLVEKFQQQMLGQQGGGSKLSDGRVGLGVETILDVMKNKDALEKFTKNMGNLNGMEKNAEGAFSMNNMNGLSNLQGQLGQFMNQSGGGGGGGGGGGSGGGGSGSGGSSSGSSSPLSYQQLSNTTKLLNNLNPTNTTTA